MDYKKILENQIEVLEAVPILSAHDACEVANTILSLVIEAYEYAEVKL